jgi:4-carboxymuconolactone decarboxylase
MGHGDAAGAVGRTAPLSRADLPPSAREAFDRIADERGEVPWLFRFLLSSPDLAYRVSHLGDFLRADSAMPDEVREMLILALSRRLDFQLEWSYHEEMALQAGVSAEVVDALRGGLVPPLSESHRLAYDLAMAAVDRRVTAEVFDAVVAQHGTAYAVDLVVLVAFVVFMQHLVEALDVPLPEGVPARLPVAADPGRPGR